MTSWWNERTSDAVSTGSIVSIVKKRTEVHCTFRFRRYAQWMVNVVSVELRFESHGSEPGGRTGAINDTSSSSRGDRIAGRRSPILASSSDRRSFRREGSVTIASKKFSSALHILSSRLNWSSSRLEARRTTCVIWGAKSRYYSILSVLRAIFIKQRLWNRTATKDLESIKRRNLRVLSVNKRITGNTRNRVIPGPKRVLQVFIKLETSFLFAMNVKQRNKMS